MNKRQFLVVHLGARMHYAVPEFLHAHSMLRAVFTDLWKPHLPAIMRKILPQISSRYNSSLADTNVISNSSLGLKYALALRRAKNRQQETAAFLEMGKRFCSFVGKELPPDFDGIYAFNSAAKEVFEHPKSQEKLKILEQTLVPRITERHILSAEIEALGFSDQQADPLSPLYEQREAEEWELADLIICASEFVKTALVEQGVSEQKIRVIPYGYGKETPEVVTRVDESKTRFLFVGNGGVRKGLFYLARAIERMNSNSTLTICGKISEHEKMWFKTLPNVTFLGSVNPTQMPKVYRSHDVLVLPSLCEGSATVVYEALNYGLPTICTPNSGSVITHQKDGLIVPIRNSEALSDAMILLSDTSKWQEMSEQTLKTTKEYTVAKYGERLVSVLQNMELTTEI